MTKSIKYIFCCFLFLFPLFFIPQEYISQNLSKTMFLAFFALLLLLFNFFQVVKTKKINFNFNNTSKVSLMLISSLILSLVFSKNLSLSFFGINGESFFAFISILIIFYFAKSIEKKDITQISSSFVTGVTISSFIFLINRLFNIDSAFLNSVASLAIMASLVLIIIIYNYLKNKNDYRSLIGICYGLSFIIILTFLIIIDYRFSWFIVSLGSFFIFWKLTMEKDFNFKDKKVIISLISLCLFLSLFFIDKPWTEDVNEKRLSYDYSLSVAGSSLIESPKSFLLGSGIGTYNYQFSLYKDKYFNSISPSINFYEGATSILTFIVTLGLLGTISLLFLIFYFYFRGFKNFSKEEEFIFPIVFCLSLTFFFHGIDILLISLFFIFLGFWDNEKNEKEININFIKILSSIVLIFLLLSSFYYYNYIKSDYHYNKAISNFENGDALSRVIIEMEESIKLFDRSDYHISLSKLYLIKASDYFKERWITKEKKEEQNILVENNILKAESFAKKASEIDYNNFLVWQNLGLLYENANYLIGDKYIDAISSYEKAKSLAPYNYDIYFSLGRVLENKGDSEAFEYYKKAFELNNSDEELKSKIESYE